MSDGFSITLSGEALDRLVDEIAERVKAELSAVSPWLNRKEAAEYLAVPLSRLERDRSVPNHRWDGRILYDRAELDEWIRSR